MDNTVGYTIIERLDVLIKLTALDFLEDKTISEQVGILSDIGLQPKEIADILGKTRNNVNVTLSHLRKKKKTTKK